MLEAGSAATDLAVSGASVEVSDKSVASVAALSASGRMRLEGMRSGV